jgi:hypothetical protein
MQRYTVIGIVQCGIGGEWSESGITATVEARDADRARARVLAQQAEAIHEHAPHAIVRWNTPELTRAIPQPARSWTLPMNGTDYHHYGEE